MPLIPPAAKIPLPIQEVLAEFFIDLLGKGAAASKGRELKLKPETENKYVVAVYEDNYDRVGALCISELMMAAVSGAALVMAAPSILPEVMEEKKLPENLFDNYKEVVNILCSVLNTPHTPHLKLRTIHAFPDEPLDREVWDILDQPSNRRDFEIHVEGYGGGKLSILAR
jgi:hypothetical protein